MPDVVGGFVREEECERRRHPQADLGERARPRGAEDCFQFGDRQLDRVDVRTGGWQKPELCADLFNGGAHLWLSSTTTSPRRNVRTGTCSTYARNVTPSMGPSNTAVAVRRPAATTVCVCQWLHGV